MITQLRPSQLGDWLASLPAHSKPVLLDVREPHEVAFAHVTPPPGLQLLTIPMGSIPSRLNEIDSEQPVACLCHHGGRSMQVAHFLQSHGYDQLANIAGGIHAWSAEVDPSVPVY